MIGGSGEMVACGFMEDNFKCKYSIEVVDTAHNHLSGTLNRKS